VTGVRATFVEAAWFAARLLADPNVEAHWDGPSALAEMSVGALAGHLARRVLLVQCQLTVPAEPEPAGGQPSPDLLAPISLLEHYERVAREAGRPPDNRQPSFPAKIMEALVPLRYQCLRDHGASAHREARVVDNVKFGGGAAPGLGKATHSLCFHPPGARRPVRVPRPRPASTDARAFSRSNWIITISYLPAADQEECVTRGLPAGA
jgi:hypothetical protein